MTKDQIMALADAYAIAYVQESSVVWHEARAALEAALANALTEKQEPSARLMTWIGDETYPKKCRTVARTYEECPKDAYPNDWEEGALLFTHPAPVNQQLLEALKWLDIWMGHRPLYECIDKVRAAIAQAEGKV